MSTGTIAFNGVQDMLVYNGSSVTITAHSAVSYESSETAVKMPINEYVEGGGPLESQGTMNILGVEMTPVTTDSLVCGIAQENIAAGEWGIARVVGPTLVRCTESTSDAHGTAYGAGAGAAGALIEITITQGGTPNGIACCGQVGTSGATTAGDKRQVFADCRVQIDGNPGVMGWS